MVNSSDNFIHVQVRAPERIQSLNRDQKWKSSISQDLREQSISQIRDKHLFHFPSKEDRGNEWYIPEGEKNNVDGCERRKLSSLNKRITNDPSQMIHSRKLSNEYQFNQSNSSKRTISNLRSFENHFHHQILDSKRRRKKPNQSFCSCSPLCKLLILLVLLLFLSLIAALCIFLFVVSKTTRTTTSIDSLSLLPLLLNTSTTSTTTTTLMSCSFSCLNRSWISSSSLLAKWTFDGYYFDQTNNYNVTPMNNPSFVSNGYINEAIWFSSNQYLYTSYVPLTSTSFTIELWLFPTGYPNINDHSLVGLCSNPYNNQCLHITIRKISLAYHFYFAFFGDNCLGIGTVPLFTWTHAAFVFDLSVYSLSIYINGILDQVCTSATPLLATNTSTPLTIASIPGIVSAYGTNFFQGYIDHLTIFNRVKASCEILDDASLVTYLPFDNGSLFIDAGPNALQSIAQSVSSVSSGHSFQAIHFINSSSFIQISDLTALGMINQAFSTSLWIRPYSLQGILLFLSKTALGTQWSIPMLGFATNGSLIAQILDTQVISILDLSPLIISSWTHLVLTWSSINGLRLYVNNILVSSLSSATSYTASSAQNYLTLGNSPQGSGTCTPGLIPLGTGFNGDMDEMRVYNRELTTDDVCALYRK